MSPLPPVIAQAEEAADLSAPGEESTIKWYIGEETFDRIAMGMVCSNCLEPFPAPPSIRNTSRWREQAHEYAGLRTPDEVMSIISRGQCPVCQTEVSTEMTSVMHRGADPFAPKPIEVPE